MATKGHRGLVEGVDIYDELDRMAEPPACPSPDRPMIHREKSYERELSMMEGPVNSSFYGTGEEYRDTDQDSLPDEFAEPSDGHENPAGATETSSSPSGQMILRSDFTANSGQGKRKEGPNGRRDQDDEDDGGFKRPRPNMASSPAVSMQYQTRFACPYQKSDPKACGNCGKSSRNGTESGFRDFHRVV